MDEIPTKADVVVIGGGPAGSIAASRLAQSGIDVVLLEAAKHPRPIVGESLIPHFWKFTDAVGATEAIEKEGFIKKSGGLAYWQNQLHQLKFSDFGYNRPALHVERDSFDMILIRNAAALGVRVFEETRATSIEGYDDRPIVHYRTKDGDRRQIETQYIVDASGQSALLAKKLGIREFDPDIRFMSLWGYYTGGKYLTADGDIHNFEERRDVSPATLVTSIGDWGWVWQIVMREKVSVGIVLPPEKLKAFKAAQDTKESKFQGMVAESALIGELMKDATFDGKVDGIRDYAYKPVQLAVGRCYMAGDAAAFVDPINSAGIVFAMYAGFASAWSIAQSLKKPARSEHFRSTYCKLYGDRLSLFRLLALPSDSEGLALAIEDAGGIVSMTGQNEQQLMLLQATLNGRSHGITEVMEKLGLSSDIEARRVKIPESIREAQIA